MTATTAEHFDRQYQTHIKHIKLKEIHRHPERLFPNRHGGMKAAHRAKSPQDRGGVQTTLRQVAF